MNIRCEKADYDRDGAIILELLNSYATDPLGGETSLPEYTKQNLIGEMKKRPEMCITFIAYVDDEPAGIANCVVGFSSFACKSLLNIHDFTTIPKFRRRGVAKQLLQFVEDYARDKGMCKVTLEVLENNLPAKMAYLQHGFKPFELRPQDGAALFFQKYV